MDPRLRRSLEPVARRQRALQRRHWLIAVWLMAAIIGGILCGLERVGIWHVPGGGLAVLAIAAAAALLAILVSQTTARHPRRVAAAVEAAFPLLRQGLLTAISQQPDEQGRFGFLQRRVVDETLTHAKHHRWTDAVPRNRMLAATLWNIPALLLLLCVASLLGFPQIPIGFASRSHAPRAPERALVIQPGDADVERGTGLMVTARFEDQVPSQATLIWTDLTGQHQAPMRRSLDDPVFAAPIAQVDQPLTYHVAFDDGSSDEYQITVFEFPRLARADARLHFPEYTGLPNKTVEDTLRVSAVVGTELTWICRLNKRVATAELVDEEGGKTIALQAIDPVEPIYQTSLTVAENRRWTLQLRDRQGRANKFPPQLVLRALPNEPAKIKLASATDVRVSPLEELPVQATLQDDYGLTRFGVSYSIPGQQPTEIQLGEAAARGKPSEAVHLIDFESLQAEPDQLLAYHFWAEDVAPDGSPRRTFSDMFFAEVRPFEEVFREGQAPPGGQQQQQQQSPGAQAAEELAELQKQIINATWTLVRRELGPAPSDAFGEDVQLLIQSQQTAAEQLDELAQQVSGTPSADFIELARNHMHDAIAQLTAANSERSADPLQTALASEQAAYQTLLKLRAREMQVVRSSQQQSGGSSSSRGQMQQQLDQLELKNDQNRYEQQQQAQEEADPQQREMRQILSRLRELAQRQEDLNKQIQQMQSALEAAETEAQREEIARQLKRLRDQQQELLRDADELADRMEQASDNQAVQEARQQLEETRENLRRASEALAQQQPSQALAAGSRAESELKEMRDAVRREASGQFDDAVREMREAARDLADRQQQLGESMRSEQQNPDVSDGLRGSPQRQQTAQQLAEQNERLSDLLNRMQQTVQDAESTEPLLAEKLYEAVNDARQEQVGQQLKSAAELMEFGFEPQAQEMESQAREGIDRLRDKVDKASQSVLGDETEALRRAVNELDQLSDALNEEIQRNAPGERATAQQPGEQQPGEQQPGEQQPGEQQPGEQQPGEQQPGEQQPGEQQPGEQQPGEQQPGGQQPGGQQPGGQQPDGQQPGGQQPGGQQPGGQQPGGQQPGGQQPGGQQPGGQQPGGSLRSGGGSGGGSLREWQDQPSADALGGWETAGDNRLRSPITGDGFREWSDRLRDVEEMVEDPQLSAEAARIRDRAREIRRDVSRHSAEPQWPLVREMIAQPLERLRAEVSAELIRRSAERNAVVPIDRDPVPERFTEAVRKYYERIGSGQ